MSLIHDNQMQHISQANTTRGPNVSLMLGQRRRRWPNIKLPLVQPLVFTRNKLCLPKVVYCFVFVWIVDGQSLSLFISRIETSVVT